MRKKILISGGLGKFAKQLLLQGSKKFEIHAPSRQDMDISSPRHLYSHIIRFNPDYFIHAAAMTRPMRNHEISPIKSMKTNIEGTCNVVEACCTTGLKVIYISTDYVYPGNDGNYSESDGLLPFTKYGWSKLGGECSVRIYDNSLILRVCICDYPFPHNQALTDVKKSMMYNFEAAEIIVKLLDQKGVINIGGKSQTVYDFASKDNPNIKKVRKQDIKDVYIAPDTSMDTSKMRRIIND